MSKENENFKVGDVVLYKNEPAAAADYDAAMTVVENRGEGEDTVIVMRWDDKHKRRVREEVPAACLKVVQDEE